MKAHDLAVKKVKEFSKNKERPLTESDIRSFNKIILKEPFWKSTVTPDGQSTRKKTVLSQHKKQPNHVQTATGEIFKFG